MEQHINEEQHITVLENVIDSVTGEEINSKYENRKT
jgi:hypothetical protein